MSSDSTSAQIAPEEIQRRREALRAELTELDVQEAAHRAALAPATVPEVMRRVNHLAAELEQAALDPRLNHKKLRHPSDGTRRSLLDARAVVLAVLGAEDQHTAAAEALDVVEHRIRLNWTGELPAGGRSAFVALADELVSLTAPEPPHERRAVVMPVWFYMDDADLGTYSAAVEVDGKFYHRYTQRPKDVHEFGDQVRYQETELTPYPYRRLEKYVPDEKREELKHIPVTFPLLLTKPFRNGWRSWIAAPNE